MTSDSGFGGVWSLADKGFKVIRERLGPLQEIGFKSEAVGHDLLSMAAMLGEWLIEKPNGVETFSEQQLRRYDSNVYPSWVPNSELHRADGYWRFSKMGSNGVIALEVERFRKEIKSYDLVCDFYEDLPTVHSVLWITPISKSNPIGDRIVTYNSKAAEKHIFVDLNDFTVNGWQARIGFGKDIGKTLSEMMIAWSSPIDRPCDSRLLLETRKKPMKLMGDTISATHAFFN